MASSSQDVAIALEPTEEALCTLLDQACRWISAKQPQPDKTESGGVTVSYHSGWTCEARIAGGWVRDKLLGHSSHDLDVSLSTLTGHIFALLLRSYLLSDDFRTSALAADLSSPFHGDSSERLVGHISRIAANPEQSKNLETATAKVAGLQLDFVNLRKEVYEENSRIPKMTFGSPLEDAQRRDITINTLFYNVHSRLVEDFTGMGLSDMQSKLVRTPLSPRTTFLDDPLRVLRCVRFASRYRYEVHPDIVSCLVVGQQGDSEEIRKALREKVSRERFGIEVDKMLRGPDPLLSFQLMRKMNLFDIIFHPPPSSGRMASRENLSSFGDDSSAIILASLLDCMWAEARRRDTPSSALGSVSRREATLSQMTLESIPLDLLQPLLDEGHRRQLFLGAALYPLTGWMWEEKKGKWVWAGECVIMNGLKLGVKNTKDPLSSLVHSRDFLARPAPMNFEPGENYRGSLIPALAGHSVSPRATLALLFRPPMPTTSDWGLSPATCILWNMIVDVFESGEEAVADHVALWKALQPLLPHLEEKGLLDGREVGELLGIKPGKLMPRILTRVVAWQFDQIGQGSLENLKEKCKLWLKEEWDKGGIVPVAERDAQTNSKPSKRQKKRIEFENLC